MLNFIMTNFFIESAKEFIKHYSIKQASEMGFLVIKQFSYSIEKLLFNYYLYSSFKNNYKIT